MTDVEVGMSQSRALPREAKGIKMNGVPTNGINSELGLSLLRNAKAAEVKIGKGNGAITWYLPKDLLIHNSTFFYATLAGNLQEANTLKITLPKANPSIFELFVQWLFIGLFKLKSTGTGDRANELIQAWILGDKIGCPTFQDSSMRLLLQRPYVIVLADHALIKGVYDTTPASSKLRQLLVALFLFVSMDDGYSLLKSILPEDMGGLQEFATDVVKEVSEEGRAVGCLPSSNSARYLLRPTSEDV